MLRIINFEDSPTADPSSDNIKFPSRSALPIIELQTPFHKEKVCKFCRYGDSALNHLIWVCCCDIYNRFAHESCLKTSIFSSIKAISSDSAQSDTESWRRCSECFVIYRIEFTKRSRLNCEKLKYNLSEHTGYVVITGIVCLVLLAGLITLALITSKIIQVTNDYTNTVMIGLYAGIVVVTLSLLALNFVLFRAHWIIAELIVSRIHGVDESVPDQELGLDSEDIVQLDLDGEKKVVLLRR